MRPLKPNYALAKQAYDVYVQRRDAVNAAKGERSLNQEEVDELDRLKADVKSQIEDARRELIRRYVASMPNVTPEAWVGGQWSGRYGIDTVTLTLNGLRVQLTCTAQPEWIEDLEWFWRW